MTLDLNTSTIGIVLTIIGSCIGFFKTFSKMQHTNESQNEEIKNIKNNIMMLKQDIKTFVNATTFEKTLKDLKEEISKMETKNDETIKQIMELSREIGTVAGILKQKFQ